MLAPFEVDDDARRRRLSTHNAVHQRLDGVADASVDEPLVKANQTAALATPEQHFDAAVRRSHQLDALPPKSN